MSEGNLRARFTSNVGKVTAPAGELREHLQAVLRMPASLEGTGR
jgi:hypothetical protein